MILLAFSFLLFLHLPHYTDGEKITLAENDELLAKCGRIDAYKPKKLFKVFNGKIANRSVDAPWSVGISTPGGRCSGSLISSRHVLLAAHCFVNLQEDWEHRNSSEHIAPNSRIHIHDACLNEQLCSYHNITSSLKTVNISKIFLPKNAFKSGAFLFDLAVLELDADLQISTTLFPACLSESPAIVGSQLEIYGYGLASADIYDGGLLRHHVTYVQEPVEYGTIPTDNFVTESNTTTRVCEGDSGAAMFSRLNGTVTIVGVVSTSSAYCNSTGNSQPR